MRIKDSVSRWARRIKRDAVMLWFARRHPDTPFFAKALCFLAVAYALSPIDLIPDAVPGAGLVDDATVLAFVLARLDVELDRFAAWERTAAITIE